MSFNRIIIILMTGMMFILLIIKCGSALYFPNKSDVSKTGIALDTLIMGRKYYVEYCSSCHNLYLPGNYNKEQWKGYVDSMQQQSNITDEQKEIILKYLSARSRQ